MQLRKNYIAALFALVVTINSTGQAKKVLSVKVDKPIADIQQTMWGVFFEDINMGADGGIYAELVKNRSFEFFKPFMGWKVDQVPFKEGAVTILNREGKNISNPRYLRVSVAGAVSGNLSITNEGFRGMGIKNGLRYDFSFMYRLASSGITIHAELINGKNEVIGSASVKPSATGMEWKRLGASFNATGTEEKAQLKIWFEGTGVIDIDMISLFPEDTWKNRPGGMRADMIQMLADMKPGFIRFPGGCIVEGYDLSQRYQWKKTIGPIEDRELIINRWNFEFAHRPAPDYFQTFGLGFFEYFQLAEDIGAEPLPILNCGMACQFNSAELVPLDQLDAYVQDALDLVEFANGDGNTKWGKVRTDMGHPQPFNLKMLGVGNENWGPQYIERLKIFKQAIKTKYPSIKLVTSSGTDPNGERFDLLNAELRKMNADIIDEHYYRRPEWFFSNTRRYDTYPRNESKIFAGEYAAQSDKIVSVDNKNSWLTALSEAAFMTGLERNADVVCMASYAPLFAHADGWQWTPDLIWVNNLQCYGTPDYHVQKLFSVNKGSKVVPITLADDVVAGQDSLYASSCIDTLTNELIIKLVNASGKEQALLLWLNGVRRVNREARITLLQSDDVNAVNSFSSPYNVSPKEAVFKLQGKKTTYKAPVYSLSVIKIKLF